MISKKDKAAKCPFNKMKPCDKECSFFRSGVRYNEVGGESFPFEACAINLIADNLEAMHQRTHMMQQELGDTKNMMALKTLSDLGLADDEIKDQLSRLVKTTQKSIE